MPSDLTVLHNSRPLRDWSNPTALAGDRRARHRPRPRSRFAARAARAHAWQHASVHARHPRSGATWSPPTRTSKGAAGRTSAASAFIPLLAAYGETDEILGGCSLPQPAPTHAGDHIRVLGRRARAAPAAGGGTIRRCWPVRTPPAPPRLPRYPAQARRPLLRRLRPHRAGSQCRALRFPRTPGARHHPDGDPRDGAAVCELHDPTSAPGHRPPGPSAGGSAPPRGSASFTDHDDSAFQVFITDQADTIWRRWRARHPRHARVEDGSAAASVGAEQPALPRLRRQRGVARAGARAQDLVAWTQRLCLTGEAAMGTEAAPLLPLPRRCPLAGAATAVPASAALLALGGLLVRRSSDCAPPRRLTPASAPIPGELFGDPPLPSRQPALPPALHDRPRRSAETPQPRPGTTRDAHHHLRIPHHPPPAHPTERSRLAAGAMVIEHWFQ